MYHSGIYRQQVEFMEILTVFESSVSPACSCVDSHWQQMVCTVQIRRNRQLYSTVCGHIFCSACIKQAIDVQHMCPTCRKRLTKRQIHQIYLWPGGLADTDILSVLVNGKEFNWFVCTILLRGTRRNVSEVYSVFFLGCSGRPDFVFQFYLSFLSILFCFLIVLWKYVKLT